MSGKFSRFITGPFRKALTNRQGAPLLDALRRFDLRIRDEALNFYSAGSSILKVTPSRLELHAKYAKGTAFDAGRENGYVTLPFTSDGVAAFLRELEKVLLNVNKHRQPEAECEELLVQANATGTPLMIVDRQVRMPRDPEGSRLDVVAVTSGPVAMLVALELKQGLDARIQEVPHQLDRYLRMLDPEGKGLRNDVARAYRVALQQLKSLGRPAPDPKLIKPGMPVRGLLVLANYNLKSELLNRARKEGRSLPRALFLLVPSRCDEPLLGPERWAPLM